MKKRKLGSNMDFEKLELRRLLAADCSLQSMPEAPIEEPVQCEVDTCGCACGETTRTDSSAESTTDTAEADTVTPDPRVLDLADGIDGYFGTINSENPAETIEFTAVEDGMVDVVLTSSFGSGNAAMTITNSQGERMDTQSSGVSGFDISSFEAKEGETYQLSISSENADCEGQFQLTVAFKGFVDQHANEMGCDSTELELIDNSAEMAGRLESAGDVDTFRLTATSSGEMTLDLGETVDDARVGLNVTIQDATGNVMAEGVTNKSLQISFDAEAGQDYFVAISAGECQKATYQFALTLEPAADQPTECGGSEAIDKTVDTDIFEPVFAASEVVEIVATETVVARAGGNISVAVDQSVDIRQQIDGPLVVASDNQSDVGLSDSPVDGDRIEATDFGNKSNSVRVAAPDSRRVARDVMVSGDQLTNHSQMENAGSIIGLENLGVIDNFFAVHGNELELHFNFFNGPSSLSRISLRG